MELKDREKKYLAVLKYLAKNYHFLPVKIQDAYNEYVIDMTNALDKLEEYQNTIN